MEKFIVKKAQNGESEIYEKVTLKDINDNDVEVLQPRGTYSLAAMYGERARLQEMLNSAQFVIDLIEQSNENSTMAE